MGLGTNNIINPKASDLDKKRIENDIRNTNNVNAFKTGIPLAERKPVNYIYYTLMEGDSISNIGDFYTSFLRNHNLIHSIHGSKAYNEEIKKLNSLNNDLICYVGQKLKLPMYAISQANEPMVFPSTKPKLKPDYQKKIIPIKIKNGDTLINISKDRCGGDWQKWKLIFDINKALSNSSVDTPSLIQKGGTLYIPKNGFSYLDIFDCSPLAIKYYTGKETKFTTKKINSRDGGYSQETTIYSQCIAKNLIKINLTYFDISIVDKAVDYNLAGKINKSDDRTKLKIDLILNSLVLDPTISYDSSGRIGLSFTSKSGNDLYDYEFSAGAKTGKLLTGSLKITTKKLVQTEFGAWKGSISLSVEVEVGGCPQEKKGNYEILVQVSILAISTVNLIWLSCNNVTGVGALDDGLIPYYLNSYNKSANFLFNAILRAVQ